MRRVRGGGGGGGGGLWAVVFNCGEAVFAPAMAELLLSYCYT